MMATEVNDILYGELRMRQPVSGRGPRVNVDTVLLADFARPQVRSRIMEMGCAHGAIALMTALRRKKLFPDKPTIAIDAFDINAELIELARENASANDLADDVRFFTEDLRDIRGKIAPESYDAVIMNPPFDDPRSSRPSKDAAVAAAMHGTECSLSDVIASAKYILKNGGKFFSVMRAKRAAEYITMLTESNMRPKRLRAVHPKIGSDASTVLIEAVRDGGEGIIIESPMFIYGDDGEYTRELLDAYKIKKRGGGQDCR